MIIADRYTSIIQSTIVGGAVVDGWVHYLMDHCDIWQL